MDEPTTHAKKLFIRVDPEVHTLVKIRAALAGISVQDWIRQVVIEALKNETTFNLKSPPC